MNITKIFFTLVFFFTMGLTSQAQVQNNNTDNDGATALAKKTEIKLGQIEETLAIESNTYTKAESNITTTTPKTESYAFYFNHKQFLKPVIRKSALC